MNLFEHWDERLIRDVGYRRLADIDSEGIQVIGYGCRIDQGLSQEEAEAVFQIRIRNTWAELAKARPAIYDCPIVMRGVLYNLAFSVTAKGLSQRARFWGAVKKRRYDLAMNDILRMPIAKTSPERVRRLYSQTLGALKKMQRQWESLRIELERKYRVDRDAIPDPLRVSLGFLLELELDTVLEYDQVWHPARNEDWPEMLEALASVPLFKEDVGMPQRIAKSLANNETDANFFSWIAQETPSRLADSPKPMYQGTPLY